MQIDCSLHMGIRTGSVGGYTKYSTVPDRAEKLQPTATAAIAAVATAVIKKKNASTPQMFLRGRSPKEEWGECMPGNVVCPEETCKRFWRVPQIVAKIYAKASRT